MVRRTAPTTLREDVSIRLLLLGCLVGLLLPAGVRAEGKVATLYKKPLCGSWEAYADGLPDR